nr:MAG: replication associated protein [Cressdnaviricota sp.]
MDGNTSSSISKPRVSAALHWDLTLNNYTTQDVTELESKLRLHCLDFRVQSEVGEEGTPHLQGYIKLKKKGRPIELFKMPRISFRVARNIPALKAYVCKTDTADGKVVLQPEPVPPTSDWELGLLSLLAGPSCRTIHWYWSRVPESDWPIATYIQRKISDVLTINGTSVPNNNTTGSIILILAPPSKGGCDYEFLHTKAQEFEGHIVVFAPYPPAGIYCKGRWNVVDVVVEECVQDMVHRAMPSLHF